MSRRDWLFVLFLVSLCVCGSLLTPAPACCPVTPSGKPVVNADQTVIILWDETNKTQHFIRKASFKSEADDFGFIVPSPSQPELSESGNEAFPYLQKLTEPEIRKEKRPSGGGGCITCGVAAPGGRGLEANAVKEDVRVLEEKLVAGFQASVLEADSADALTTWLKNNGYAFSPAVEAWARPYIDGKWKFTALKVAKSKERKTDANVSAAALRITFKTDKPLFPYREPDYGSATNQLGVRNRLLRIYFLAEARYQGELTNAAWTGNVAWANKLSAENRKKTLELMKLPETTGPAEWWLTEFEDNWPYKVAPADVYFTRAVNQQTVKRPPIIQYVSAPAPTDIMTYALVALVIVPPMLNRVRRR
jgi:hypothetical protein